MAPPAGGLCELLGLRDGLVHLLELVRDHAGALRVAERHRGVGERALNCF